MQVRLCNANELQFSTFNLPILFQTKTKQIYYGMTPSMKFLPKAKQVSYGVAK